MMACPTDVGSNRCGENSVETKEVGRSEFDFEINPDA